MIHASRPAEQQVANTTKTISILGSAIVDIRTQTGSILEKPGGNITGTSNHNPPMRQIDLHLNCTECKKSG